MPEPQFQHIHCFPHGRVLLVELLEPQLHGDHLAEAMREEILAAHEHFQANKIIVDFQKVTSLSSAGLRPFLSLNRKLKNRSGRMIFCHLSPELVQLLSVMRMIGTSKSSGGLFETAATFDEALAHLKHHTATLEGNVLVLVFADRELLGEDLA